MMNTNETKHGDEPQAKYLSFLSHDVRGGLNSVLLMIEVIRHDLESAGEGAQSLEDLDVMKRTILETVGTMERFVHSERLRLGLFVIKPSRVDLRQFLATISQQFVYAAREKGVKLVQEVAAGSVATADREVLSMVMANLISNAAKYSDKGTIRVGCSGCGQGEKGPARIYVSDDGPGIESEKLSELLATTAPGKMGIGSGLSIARQGAEMLGAKLSAESEVGKGSSFYLELLQGKAT